MESPTATVPGPSFATDYRPKPCSGVTLRAVVLCLGLAALFGYLIPLIDYKLFNTFLGATHLPPGAIATLLVLLLVVNPLFGQTQRVNLLQSENYESIFRHCLPAGATLVVLSFCAPSQTDTDHLGLCEETKPA